MSPFFDPSDFPDQFSTYALATVQFRSRYPSAVLPQVSLLSICGTIAQATIIASETILVLYSGSGPIGSMFFVSTTADNLESDGIIQNNSSVIAQQCTFSDSRGHARIQKEHVL